MTAFTYAQLFTFAALAVSLARMFMFDVRRCAYCGARSDNAHSESCPQRDRLGQ